MIKSVDEIIAACCAAKAQGHAEDAARSAARAREAVATFEASRELHADPYIARSAGVSVRLRTTRAVQHAAQNVRGAEFQAEKARRAAKTPLARKYATTAGEFLLTALSHADSASAAAHGVCMLATRDAWLACRAYRESLTESD
jgi:hypothetical protein